MHISTTHVRLAAVAAMAATLLTACNSIIEEEGDCPEGLALTFRYDYNLQRADMFTDHVGSLTAFIYDESGSLASTRPIVTGGQRTFTLTGLAPGRYRVVAIATQAKDGGQTATGRAPFTTSGQDNYDRLAVTLSHENAVDDTAAVDHHSLPIDTLWTGASRRLVTVERDEVAHDTISLVRHTKHIHVALRDMDHPGDTDVADYDMAISAPGATLRASDYSVDESTVLRYTPYRTWNTTDRDALPDASVGRMAHADFMTSRLVYHDQPATDARLTVKHRPSGRQIVNINLVDYLAQMMTSDEQGLYSNRQQEFLDRGYDYRITLFVKGGRLTEMEIQISILSWTKRFQFETI